MVRRCLLVLATLCVFNGPTLDAAAQDRAAERGVMLQLEPEPSRWGPPEEWKEGGGGQARRRGHQRQQLDE
jgi:hypothetical protein